MKFYLVLPKDFDCSLLEGTVDMSAFGFILYETVDEALLSETDTEKFDSDKYFIALIEFLDKREIMNAIMSSYMGNTHNKFNIRILETIVITAQGRIRGRLENV